VKWRAVGGAPARRAARCRATGGLMARACAPARGGQALRLRAGMRRARARARVAWCMYKGVRALALHCRKRHCFVSSSP